jgi:hypothetical protein
MRLALALAFLCQTAAVALANDARVLRALKNLDPEMRFEQVCDLEAMKRIAREAGKYRPERTVVGALSLPKVKGATMTGDGGAFYSKGAWYRFSFTCSTSPDHMQVTAFTYQIGDPIPEAIWEEHGLGR